MNSTPAASATATPPPSSSTGATMPFGKHRGLPLKNLPAEYLLWLGCLPDLRQPLLGHVLREMGLRIVEADQQKAAAEREGAR